jgi:LmbE family N-acetylglucosaminyl deacetylase
MSMSQTASDALHPRVVLGIAAHPDDLDYYAGGSMAAFARQGAAVYYLILTDGGKGSEDRTMKPEVLRDIRRGEQRKAGEILGLKDVYFLDYPDGALENTLAVKREIVKTIRTVKPDVVVALDPSVVYSAQEGFINHPDHRAAGQAALDAVYPLARDHLSLPELLAEGHEPHKTKTVLLIRYGLEGTSYAVDISDTLELKLQALSAHASQFGDQERIKSELSQHAAVAGEPYGYMFAEQFLRIDIS